jgi:uncharacterized UBP type Zn finger protein
VKNNSVIGKQMLSLMSAYYENPTLIEKELLELTRPKALNSIEYTQQDCSELLTKLDDFFDMSHYLLQSVEKRACSSCNTASEQKIDVNFLQLYIQDMFLDEGRQYLNIEHYFKTPIHGSIEKNCDSCKINTKHYVKNSWIQNSPHLVININRTGYKNGGTFKYLDKIDVSCREIKYKKYSYNVQSFIVHEGSSINAGHYVCYRKIKEDNQESWYKISDRKIIKCDEFT